MVHSHAPGTHKPNRPCCLCVLGAKQRGCSHRAAREGHMGGQSGVRAADSLERTAACGGAHPVANNLAQEQVFQFAFRAGPRDLRGQHFLKTARLTIVRVLSLRRNTPRCRDDRIGACLCLLMGSASLVYSSWLLSLWLRSMCAPCVVPFRASDAFMPVHVGAACIWVLPH